MNFAATPERNNLNIRADNAAIRWLTPRFKDVRDLVVRYPLPAAFLLSLIIHLCLYQGYRISKRLGWWDYQPSWIAQLLKRKPSAKELAAQKKMQLQAAEEQKRREVLMSFMEVPPDRVAAEPPKDAKYYGAANSRAANPDPAEKPVPKIDGNQTKIERIESVPREPKDKFPLAPALPPPDQAKAAEESQPKPKPRPADTPGDLAMRRPDERKVDDPGTAENREHTRPRSVQEAKAKRNMTAGERMKQQGGVRNMGRVSLDVKATAFGAYDAAFIAAVQDRWYTILDAYPYSLRSGKVVLHFKLMHDGRIIEMKVQDDTVGELQSLFCQRAIKEPSPYAPWPSDMRRMIGDNFREVTFTFYYN